MAHTPNGLRARKSSVRVGFAAPEKQGNRRGNTKVGRAKILLRFNIRRSLFKPHQPPHLIQVSSSAASISRRPFSFLERLSRAAHHRADISRSVTRQLMLRRPASRHSASPSSCLTRLHTPPSPRPCDHARGLRPICHRNEDRIEAHIVVAFPAYCPQLTLKARLRALAGGLTPRQALDKLKSLQRGMRTLPLPTGANQHPVVKRHAHEHGDHEDHGRHRAARG